MKELKQTVELMNSDDYKERFIAEYWQTKIRYERLKKFLIKIEAADDTFGQQPKHDCPYHVLREQKEAMGKYLHVLELRAEIEGINLEV